MKRCIKEIDLQFNGDDRGNLVVIEGSEHIPFDIKRMFYIYGVNDNKSRGNHANIDSEFVMVALSGSVKVSIDDGKEKYECILNNPKKGLYLPKLTWKSMSEFSDNAILLVISNTHYNKEEYINNYDEFIDYVNTRGK